MNFAKIFNEFRDKFLELSFEEQKELLEKIDFIDSHEKIEPKEEKPFNLLRIRTKKRKNN